MLLVADTHFDDQPSSEYRWDVFKEIKRWILLQEHSCEVAILGDLADRKDKHSGKLVNRLVAELDEVTGMGAVVTIIKGNHDDPISGVPYWNILGKLPNVRFYGAEPVLDKSKRLWLPFTHNPASWDFSKYKSARVAFMHDTVTGAYIHHRKFMNERMPKLPTNIPIYSGDIHYPQTMGNFTYVGAPHPVRFGDDHPCRMLEIDDETFQITQEIHMPSIEKSIVTVSSIHDLDELIPKRGDQMRVRLSLKASRVEQWAEDERAVMEWAEKHGVEVASVEALVETDTHSKFLGEALSNPFEVYDEFCKAEGLTGDIYTAGMELLKGH
jgi:hypothetical protein